MRRALTVLLALCMVVSLLPVQTLAENVSAGSGLDALGVRQISEKQYAVTPDVTEYEWILNNSSLTQQMMGHVMEVKVGNGSTASIAVGYGDDNIEAIKTGRNWAMTSTTQQAKSMQARRDTNVVGAINAGGYDMSNGRPSGAFIMSGTVINRPTGTTFWIDKSGAAHITSAQECNDALDSDNVMEAVASFGDIFENGHARAGLDNTTRASRTAIGIKADGTVVMLMVDGRQAPYSVGMTMAEVGAAMEALGCVQAINLDGGGSSTFATQREGEPENETTAGLTLRCRPSDGYERKVSNTVMVLSTAKPTGEFDHAVLAPNDEVYTPGSTVQFSATGVDAAGGSAAIPAGASWSVISGGGNIDKNGLYTAPNTIGEVTVSLMVGGQSVGKTSIQLQWPDKLGFTNSSVSIDFGETSDLTFKPTWQGREVKYKDGDFKWTLDENKPISYKHNFQVESYFYPYWVGGGVSRWKEIYLSITGSGSAVGTFDNGTYALYTTKYSESVSPNVLNDGTIEIVAELTHISSTILNNDGTVYKENFTEDVVPNEEAPRTAGTKGIQNRIAKFAVGQFAGNTFVADENNSLRATAKVSLASNADVTGEIELVVGLEPLVLMDFEDGHGVNWNTYITNRANGGTGDHLGTGQLTNEHIQQYGLWVRTATNAGVDFTGSGVVSAAQDGRVRFGEKAFKLCFDFSGCSETSAAAADGGFSCDLYVNNVQPTKIGMWVNVPVDLKDCPYLLKAVMAGGVTGFTEANTDGGYNTLNADGSFTYGFFGENGQKGMIPKGTTMYTQYYGKSTDANGNEVELTTLGDMAGKGWIWVEADISSMQMPIDVYRAYTYRVVKTPTMKAGFKGNILIDNVQFIYGTNTNDITRPVMEAITETSSGTVLETNGSTVLPSGNLSFSAVYSDSELTDKYATGIDTTGIRVWLDGELQTDTEKLEINEGILYLKGMNLRNGTHTLTIRLKDFYGNVTTESRNFRVEDADGMKSAIDVLPQPEPPEIGKEYALSIVNNTGENITHAKVTVDFSAMGDAEKYLAGAKVEDSDNYTLTLDTEALSQKQAIITIEKKPAQQSLLTRLFGVRSAAEYDYVSELGNLIINIPADVKEGYKLKYTVTQGTYTIDDTATYTFSGTEQEIVFTASYQMSCEQAIAGMPADLVVTDANGKAVSRAMIYQVNGTGEPTQLGKTSMKGKLTHTFDTAGEYTFYAEKSGNGRSWNHRVIVCEKTAENEGRPFGILTNGVTTPGTKSITWLTQIDGSKAEAQVRYSTVEDLSSAEIVHGTSKLQTFVQSSKGDALRCNKVQISGLIPNTTYYYQVGDGETWSDTASFTTANGNEETNFFILGDIQSSETANLFQALNGLKDNGTIYDFAIQTGDAIDNVTNYVGNWRPFLTTVNGNMLNGVDMIHVMGNHEYYSDADGEISGVIYDLPVSTQNSWYKMEYGKVCVVVINDGVKLTETLADIAENLTTDCIWKILVAHKPIYGTNPGSNSATDEIIAAIEGAGFDFVFGGDDHAYARTYPMIRGEKQAEDSRGGVVYYVCGDLSGKNNAFEKRDCYVTAIPHNDYSGMYLTVNATEETFTVKAVKYDGTELDTYTETRTDCELGRHKVDASSKYDMTNGTITCAICEKGLEPAGEYAYSGLLTTTDDKKVILAEGNVKKNVFSSVGEDRYHSCADGYANKTTQSDSRTCVTGGYITYTCPECKATDKSDFQRPVDHKWNDEYVCTVCETKGIDINSSEVIFKLGSPENPRELDPVPNYYYAASGVRPGSFAMRGDYVLTQNNDANLIDGRIPDLFVEWPDSKNVGKAEIKCAGRGDYYGEKTLTYNIVPNDVKDLKCESASDNSLTLTWTAAPGAEYYEIFQCDQNNSSNSRKSMGTTEKTAFTVTDLKQDADYYFVVAGRTKVPTEDNKVYNSPRWSNTLHARTSPAPANVTGVSATVNGQNIAITEVDGAKYLFLPASADLTELSLTFITEPVSNKVTLTGDKGTVYLSDTVDITAVADVNAAGYREITATVGLGQAMTFRVMQASGLSTLYLTSADAENKGIAFVDADKNNVVTDAKMSLVAADGTSIYNGGLSQLKARGNSTFTYAEKKSYQIKLQTPTDLLGNQEQVKTWVLLANSFDATQMHDKLIKDLAFKLGLAYTASCDWVNLYYDGEYRGVYLLSEKNAVGATSVAITDMEKAYKELNENYGVGMTTDQAENSYGQQYQYTTNLTEPANITGGYLIELNHDMWDEVSGFKTSKGVAFNVKNPEWCGDAAMRYISEYYQEFEDAVYATDETGTYTGYNAATGKYFYDYVDMNSLVKVFLLQELSLNCDGFISSVYFYKDADGMMYAGPVWDQDMTFGTGWNKTNDADIVDYHYLANALIQIPTFKDAVAEYYNSEFAPAVREWLGTEGTVAQHYALLKNNEAMNYMLWDYIRIGNPAVEGHIWQGANYQTVVEDMTAWIEARLTNMDERFQQKVTLLGDVNGDGVVDSDDAVCILRYCVGYEVEGIRIENGDVNHDGVVNTDDAVQILRNLVGLD